MPDDTRPGPIKNSQTGTVVAAELQAAEALRMYAEKMTYAQIAARLECSKTWAYKLVHRGWERLIQDNDETRAVLREIELEHLDELQEAVWSLATGDISHLSEEVQQNAAENQLKAVNTVVKIIQTRARMRGLNVPAKIEHSKKSELMPLDELIAKVAASKQRREDSLRGNRVGQS